MGWGRVARSALRRSRWSGLLVPRRLPLREQLPSWRTRRSTPIWTNSPSPLNYDKPSQRVPTRRCRPRQTSDLSCNRCRLSAVRLSSPVAVRCNSQTRQSPGTKPICKRQFVLSSSSLIPRAKIKRCQTAEKRGQGQCHLNSQSLRKTGTQPCQVSLAAVQRGWFFEYGIRCLLDRSLRRRLSAIRRGLKLDAIIRHFRLFRRRNGPISW
jgi:hypothetical protein